MPTRRTSIPFVVSLALCIWGTQLAAQTEKVIHSFANNGKDGINPSGGVILDASGNLFGTASTGGTGGDGVVFELSPTGTGGWTEKILHNFTNTAKDGTFPTGNLVFDTHGNLYGAAVSGGAHGQGAIFELTQRAGGGWVERVIRSFQVKPDGNLPSAGLILDSAGNLYGVTELGGTSNNGTVFRLSPNSSGGFVETQLFNFNGTDGSRPMGSLIFDSNGNLYGTTLVGGSNNLGTIFELSPTTTGPWTETVLYNFGATATDAARPAANLIFDANGHLFGTTAAGGTTGGGTVFELSRAASPVWTETILYEFPMDSNVDGYTPVGGLTFDAAGNLYSTTSFGGSGACTYFSLVSGCGTIFRLTPPSSGTTWTESLLFSFNFSIFSGDVAEGPYAGVTPDALGNYYGTTYGGGSQGDGSVFQFKP